MFGQHRQARGHAAGAKSTRGWAKLEPSSQRDRRELKRRCGARAFLDPDRLKYPVVAKGSDSCAIDCRGARAAKSRAAAQHRRKLEAKADRLARRAGCKWAR